jgi:hypothetical protein
VFAVQILSCGFELTIHVQLIVQTSKINSNQDLKIVKKIWRSNNKRDVRSIKIDIMATNGSIRPTAAQKLRAMLDDPKKLIVCPGVYDGYTARIALAENVDCLYMVC